MKKLPLVVVSFTLLSLVLAACTPVIPVVGMVNSPTQDPGPAPLPAAREAQVQSVQIQVMDTDPPQVNAVVRGSLTESCATLGQSQVQYGSNTFHITVYAVSPTDRGCAQLLSPFETTVALDIRGLPEGTYTVIANGVSAVFSLKSDSPAPTAVPTARPTDVPPSQGCSDSAAFVTDVSVPDNVLFSPGTPFTKTWRLKNIGTCAWDSSYIIQWISGATMSQQPGYFIVPAGHRVQPGQTVDISVGMTSPMEVGYYTAYWGLKGRNGRLMPIAGGAGGNSFFVKIRVSDSGDSGGLGLPLAEIVDQSIEIELEQGSGEACTPNATYLVHAYVSASGPLSALYEVDSTAGQISAGYFIDPDSNALRNTVEGTVKFDASLFAADGVQTITLPFRFVGPYPYPDDITVNFWVDGGKWVSAKLPCP